MINGIVEPLIRGGGRYDIPDNSFRYVAVLGADEAIITGFRLEVIDSPNVGNVHDGTGILCDATSPVVEDNVFGGSAHAGVATLGNAHPIIRNKLFGRYLTGNLGWE